MSIHLGKECTFSFGLQGSGKGVYAAPDNWLPHVGAESLRLRPNYVDIDAADGNAYDARYFGAGKWGEGDITLECVPGSMTDLAAWIMTRDSDNQGRWASILVDAAREVKKLTDTKVRTASFPLEKGGVATVRLTLASLLFESGAAGEADYPTGAPYVFRESAVSVKTGGGGNYTADANFERITIDIDNLVEEPAEGMRLRNSDYPLQLYNTGSPKVTGTFSRDFVDTDFYDDFMADQLDSLKLVLTRGYDIVTFTLARVRLDESDAGSPGSREARIVEGITFKALGSLDGVTAPLTIGVAP